MEDDNVYISIEEEKTNDKDMNIKGIAVTTNISNNQRFPKEILKDVVDKMAGIPIVSSPSEMEAHSDAPPNYIGKVTKAWYEEKDGVGYAKFSGIIFDEKAKRVIREFPDKIKFSVRFRHSFKVDDKGVRVTDKFGQWIHLALLTNPADEKAVLEEAKKKEGDETEKAASWSDINPNELPDDAFLWIDPKYKSGESRDKNLRKFPFKWPNGKVSEPALKAICAYLHGARGRKVDIPDSDLPAIYKKLNRYRNEAGMPPCEEVKSMSEEKEKTKYEEEIKALQDESKKKDSMIEELKSKVAVLEEENTKMKQEMKHKEVEQYVDGLVEKGVIPPAVRDETVEHYAKMPDELYEEEKKLNEKKNSVLKDMTEEKSAGMAKDKSDETFTEEPPEDMKVI